MKTPFAYPRHVLAPIVLAVATSLASAQGTSMRSRLIATIPSGPGTALTVLASAPGDASRLFVGQTNGVIRVLNLDTNTFAPAPFVSLPDSYTTNGLLNLVFDPRWTTNGYFYASIQSDLGRVTVFRGRISSTDPNIADPASIQRVFRRFTVGGQHTGGMLHFGDDGFLYLTSGDQASAPGTVRNPQTLDNWAGKIFRIDVDGPDNIPGNADDDAFPADPDNLYTIPPDNPYIAVAGALPEIWARGVRNPYKTSKDEPTGNVWIGDVGGFAREEVSILPPSSPGLNFGWPIIEGNLCQGTPDECSLLHATPPLLDYPRSGPAIITGTAIIGGVVYRGCSMPWLTGTYIFGNNTDSWIATVRMVNGQALGLTNREVELGVQGVSGFALSARGEAYFCTYSTRQVYAIEPRIAKDCNNNGIPDGCDGSPICTADFDGNCGVEISDLLAFLTAFESGSLSADYDDGTGQGLIDGAITIDDLLLYLVKFEGGC